MDRTRKIVGGAVVAGLCLASTTSGGESPSAVLCQSPQQQMATVPLTVLQWAEGAQLFDSLGDFHRPVSTNSQAAQTYFDQGMRLLWAFNHDEATRSFAKAAQLDPQCAMCYWAWR